MYKILAQIEIELSNLEIIYNQIIDNTSAYERTEEETQTVLKFEALEKCFEILDNTRLSMK